MTEASARSGIAVSIVHPFDPWQIGIGGFDTFLDGFLRLAPPEWRLEVLGVTRAPRERPAGKRIDAALDGRRIAFLPVLADHDPYTVRRLPLSLRFAMAARWRRSRASGAIVQYHRFESMLAIRPAPESHASCFLHNHPPELTTAASGLRWRRLRTAFSWALGSGLSSADLVWGVDPRTPEWIAARYPHLSKSVHHLPVWADPGVFHPGKEGEPERDGAELRQRLGVAASERLCVFAGRLEAQKDPLTTVEAFAQVARRRDHVTLLFVGRGRMRSLLEARVRRLGLESRVRWWDETTRRHLARIYRGADVSICSSAFESGPRSVLESLACGTPSVAFAVGQVPRTLEPLADLGFLVQDRTSQALAASIEKALDLVPGPGLSRRCSEAVANATPERILSAVFARYQSILKGRPR